MKESMPKLERELRKAENKMIEALEQQAEAEYQYNSWNRERTNILREIAILESQKKVDSP